MIDPSDEKRFTFDDETSAMKRRLSTVESTTEPQSTRYSSAGENEIATETANRVEKKRAKKRNTVLLQRIAIIANGL